MRFFFLVDWSILNTLGKMLRHSFSLDFLSNVPRDGAIFFIVSKIFFGTLLFQRCDYPY